MTVTPLGTSTCWTTPPSTVTRTIFGMTLLLQDANGTFLLWFVWSGWGASSALETVGRSVQVTMQVGGGGGQFLALDPGFAFLAPIRQGAALLVCFLADIAQGIGQAADAVLMHQCLDLLEQRFRNHACPPGSTSFRLPPSKRLDA